MFLCSTCNDADSAHAHAVVDITALIAHKCLTHLWYTADADMHQAVSTADCLSHGCQHVPNMFSASVTA